MKSEKNNLLRLDLNLLPVLDMLLTTQSVTQTAKKLAMSAPTVSRALAQLRISFQDQLLVRSGRYLVKTPKGEALQREVKTVLTLTESLTTPPRPLNMLNCQRTFRIRCDGTLAGIVGRKLLPELKDKAPYIGIQFIGELPSGDFRADDVDVEISGRRYFPPETVVKRLGEVPLIGLVSNQHPLSSQTVDEKALVAYPHVMATIQTEFEHEMTEALRKFNLVRRLPFIVPSFFSAALIARDSNAIATMPATIGYSLQHNLHMGTLELPPALPAASVVIAWHVKFRDDFEHKWLRELLSRCMQNVIRQCVT